MSDEDFTFKHVNHKQQQFISGLITWCVSGVSVCLSVRVSVRVSRSVMCGSGPTHHLSRLQKPRHGAGVSGVQAALGARRPAGGGGDDGVRHVGEG